MRYDAPIPTTSRLALEPIEIAGHTVRRGRVVVLLLASANRDAAVFADPDRVDLSRSPNPHVSFGGGVHHCLGAALARVEGGVVFERLMARFAHLEPAGPAQWNPSAGGFRFPYWAYERIPVAGRPS